MTEKEVRKIVVLKELPKTEGRVLEDAKGTQYDVVTSEEALTEILEMLRKMAPNLGVKSE